MCRVKSEPNNCMFKKIVLISLFVLLSISVAGIAIGWYSYRNGTLQSFLVREAVQKFVPETINKAKIEKLLGFEAPRTYLVLFLNNTELRPGGGFIGSYAVVQVDKGVPHIIKVEGTEIIDNSAPDAYLTPPAVLQKYLLIKKWQFRDSNWSPDFPTSASSSLALYRAERGAQANAIDGIIAFTPSVVEKLLEVTGPIELNGEEYSSKNFTEKLEYEVEYGFAKKGIAFRDRKQTLADLSRVALGKIRGTLLDSWSEYKDIIPRMLAQKHIMMYSLDPNEQDFIIEQGWGGNMLATSSDYMLWADANLGALKTDASINRTLTYTIAPSGTTYIGKATMHYIHTGGFDWRTTRYRNYARVYVPAGSTLIEASGTMQADRDHRPGQVDQGIENGRQWFGGFISIEPGTTADLSFTFKLSPDVVTAIRAGEYSLVVQKQLGATGAQLTLQQQFGTTVTSATPAESPAHFGDTVYDYSGDLKTDKEFHVKLGK